MPSERYHALLPLAAFGLLSACAYGSEPAQTTPREGFSDVSTFAATGEPVRCVSLSSTSLSPAGPNHVIARQGSRTWRNELRGSCPTLSRDRVLVVRATGSQVCEMDSFQVLDTMTRTTFGTCVFGPFTPVEVPRGARW